jgi:hypothetical protein
MFKYIFMLMILGVFACGQRCDPEFWDESLVVSLAYTGGNCGSYSTTILESLDEQRGIVSLNRNLMCEVKSKNFAQDSCSMNSFEVCINTESGVAFEITLAVSQTEEDVFSGYAKTKVTSNGQEFECVYDLSFTKAGK